MLLVSEWHGRIGNNILQVLRCLFFAEKMGHCAIVLPKHYYFNSTEISIYLESQPVKKVIVHNFFNLTDLGHRNPSVVELKEIAFRYKKFFFPIIEVDVTHFSSSNITCHVRGGDVFSWRPHSSYLQPPLYYYEYLVDKFTNVYLIKEDSKNPVVQYLLKKNAVEDISNNEMRDFMSLMFSENLALSVSTFCFAAYLLSDIVKKIYMPDYYLYQLPIGQWPSNTEMNIVNLPGYMNPGEWKNTYFQRKKMISYHVN